MDKLLIRPESASDKDAIYTLNSLAFAQTDEADLVNTVREAGQIALSLVALLGDRLVGHVLYSDVSVEHNPEKYKVWGLGPVAVLPDHQRQGVGKQLIYASLDECKSLAVDAVVLLGHTSYYPKFGFEPASNYNLKFKSQDLGDAFMALELSKGVLASLSGAVYYVPAFG
jgi:putative acetyltransferase